MLKFDPSKVWMLIKEFLICYLRRSKLLFLLATSFEGSALLSYSTMVELVCAAWPAGCLGFFICEGFSLLKHFFVSRLF
jgi:hypothetical protein